MIDQYSIDGFEDCIICSIKENASYVIETDVLLFGEYSVLLSKSRYLPNVYVSPIIPTGLAKTRGTPEVKVEHFSSRFGHVLEVTLNSSDKERSGLITQTSSGGARALSLN